MVKNGVEVGGGRGEMYRKKKKHDKDWVRERLNVMKCWIVRLAFGQLFRCSRWNLSNVIKTGQLRAIPRNVLTQCGIFLRCVFRTGLNGPCVRCVVMTTDNETSQTNLARQSCTPQTSEMFTSLQEKVRCIFLCCYSLSIYLCDLLPWKMRRTVSPKRQ